LLQHIFKLSGKLI